MKRAALVAVAAVVVSTAALAMLRRPVELPRWGTVPTFTLQNEAGQPFGTAQLDGKIWIADFIFTSCPSVCPRMSGEMAQLQTWLRNRGLDGRVHLVSVSVDPTRDTPATLHAYAEKFHAEPRMWTFLTGPQQVIEDAVVHGFKIAVSREKDDSQDDFAIVHGTKLVLVDGTRQIRGYYDSGDRQSLAKLRTDAEALAQGRAR